MGTASFVYLLLLGSAPHRDALDLELCTLGDGCHLHAAAGRERLCKGLGILCVHSRKVVDVGQKDHGLDHIGHGQAGLGQNSLEVCQALCGLLFHGIGHLAGGGVYRDLTGHEYHIAQVQCLAVGADGGRCVGGSYDFHRDSPLLWIQTWK